MFEGMARVLARLAIRIIGVDTMAEAVFRRMAEESIIVTIEHVVNDNHDDDEDGGDLHPDWWPMGPPNATGRGRS